MRVFLNNNQFLLSKVFVEKYFLSGFVHITVLILKMVVLDAEFQAVSSDVSFRYPDWAKIGVSWVITSWKP